MATALVSIEGRPAPAPSVDVPDATEACGIGLSCAGVSAAGIGVAAADVAPEGPEGPEDVNWARHWIQSVTAHSHSTVTAQSQHMVNRSCHRIASGSQAGSQAADTISMRYTWAR